MKCKQCASVVTVTSSTFFTQSNKPKYKLVNKEEVFSNAVMTTAMIDCFNYNITLTIIQYELQFLPPEGDQSMVGRKKEGNFREGGKDDMN